MNDTIHILAINGTHSSATRVEFVAGLAARGASVEFRPSRLGDFDVVRVNSQPVARAFKTKTELLAYMLTR